MFSIEQIELIRRLRNSGITKEQVVEGFESLDRIDSELGTLYTVPVNRQSGQKDNREIIHPKIVKQQNNVKNSSVSSELNVTDKNPQNTGSQNINTTKSENNISYHIVTPRPEIQAALGNRTTKLSQVDSVNYRQAKTSSEIKYPTSTCNTSTMTRIYSKATSSMDDDDLVNKSCRDNETGHGVEYETKFIPQQNSNISTVSYIVTRQKKKADELDNCQTLKVNLKQKYSGSENTNPTKKSKIEDTVDLIEADSNQHVVDMIESAVQEKMVSIQDNGQSVDNGQRVAMVMPDSIDLMVSSYQRRERFTFREKHLEVLEIYFKENPYPSYEQRETIANMCNMACSNNGERQLHDREKVSAHMVLNWFANSRKEVKRIAKTDGVVASASILPSRINKNRSMLSDGVTPQGYTDENATSDLSNDSVPTSSDEKRPREDYIIIKCEED